MTSTFEMPDVTTLFQPIHVSKILAKLAEQEKADIVMLGKVGKEKLI